MTDTNTPERGEALTLEQLREWHIAEAQSWTEEARKHKGEPLSLDDDYQRNMTMAGFHYWIANIIDTGRLPE